MPVGVVIALISALSLVVGIVGGIIGAYVAMRIGLVKLETWRDIVDGDIKSLSRDMRLHGEDLLVHDMEIGDIMRAANLMRISRQRVR